MAASKLERAYTGIRVRIFDGRLAPGQRLVVDSLARELQVSAVPVREAIRRLESDGLIHHERNVGVRVNTMDEEQWEQAMQALALLDGYAFANAAAGMTTKIMAKARGINQQMRDCLTHPPTNAEVMGLNRAFHVAIYEACANTYVVDIVHRVWDRIDASRAIISLYVPMRLQTAVDEHDQLLAALNTGSSPTELEHAAREHNLNAITAFRSGDQAEGVDHGVQIIGRRGGRGDAPGLSLSGEQVADW